MAKEAKPKKSSNMQSFYKTKDKVEMAKYQAKGATHQMKINKAKGKLDNLDYRASTTAAGRTKDLNRANDTSKTLGRAKNIESKEAKAKQTKSRSYSPKPMTAAAKAKAAAAGKATGAKTKPKSLASKVVGRAKTVAREVRDIPTAVGAPKRMQTGTKTVTYTEGDTGKKSKYTVPKYKGNKASGIGAQLKEAAAAITAGQKGTSVGHTSASGKTKPRRSR